MPKPLIIIGTGLAGYTLAREFRALDKTTPLILLSADDGAFYSKPMLSTALARQQSADDLINSPAAKMAERLDAQIISNTRVLNIDADRQQIKTEKDSFEYSKLVLTTGAQPIRFPLPGNAADSDILSINNRQDYARFRSELGNKAKRVAIIGPGLIGCEFANDLLAIDHQVTLIGPDPYPISTLLPGALGMALQKNMSDAGAQWQLGRTVTQLDKTEQTFHLTLDDDSSLEADIILSAIGLKPDISMAEQAGLATGRGIQVNQELQTSQADIYALGDCAEKDGHVLPFVMPITFGAKALAKTLCGQPTAVDYPAMPVIIKTPLFPLCILPANGEGEWQIEKDDAGVLARLLDDTGRLRGFALGGEKVKQRQALLKEL